MTPRRCACLVGAIPTLTTLLFVRPASAEESRTDQGVSDSFFQGERAATARTYVNFRGGLATTNEAGVPEVCLEGAPFKFLTLETCGTGAGIWRDNSGTQMAHLRVELQPYRFVLAGVALDPQVGVGFAELQVGEDDPGFRFADASGKFDTSGPELSLSLQAKIPFRFDLELIGELSSGVAYFPNAPDLAIPKDELQPFAGVSLGLGF